MKKRFTRLCAWGAALLVGSLAGGCSSARKAAKTPAEKTSASDTVEVYKPVPGHPIMLLYGVRPAEYEVKEK